MSFFDGQPELLKKFRQGDRQVLRDVYAHYGEAVFRFCRDRLKSPADARDLTQEVFIAAFKEDTRVRFSGLSSFQGFLFGIAKNLLMHRFRADRVRQAFTDELSTEAKDSVAAPAAEENLEAEAAQKVLAGFLAELNERDRRFFEEHMTPRPPRRVTAEKFRMSEDQVRYLEKKLREKAVEYLKRVGYLDAAGAELQKAAAAAALLLALNFPNAERVRALTPEADAQPAHPATAAAEGRWVR